MPTFRQARERWNHAGATRAVEWKWVRRALLLGAFSLSITLLATGIWVRQQRDESRREAAAASAQADMTRYEQELSDYQRCLDRAKSGAELKGALLAGVEHAEQTEAVFVLIVTLVDRGGNESPSAKEFAAAVDDYSESIDAYRAKAENYEIVELADCPPVPTFPASLTHD